MDSRRFSQWDPIRDWAASVRPQTMPWAVFKAALQARAADPGLTLELDEELSDTTDDL